MAQYDVNGSYCINLPRVWFTWCPISTSDFDSAVGIYQTTRRTNTRITAPVTLQWRHYGRDGVSNHQLHHCQLNRLFRRRSKKTTSKLRTTSLRVGISPLVGEFPTQMASNADNVFNWWHHHEKIRFYIETHWHWYKTTTVFQATSASHSNTAFILDWNLTEVFPGRKPCNSKRIQYPLSQYNSYQRHIFETRGRFHWISIYSFVCLFYLLICFSIYFFLFIYLCIYLIFD